MTQCRGHAGLIGEFYDASVKTLTCYAGIEPNPALNEYFLMLRKLQRHIMNQAVHTHTLTIKIAGVVLPRQARNKLRLA